MASAVIGALRVNLGLDSAEFREGIKNMRSGLSKVASMAKTGFVAAAAGATAAAGAIGLAVRGTINAADDMSKAAAKIGIPIEELSKLKYAADLSGVSFEGLQTSVGRLSKVMSEAKNGSQSAIDTFSRIGVSATNADGSLKTASQVLSEISDRFASMPDGAEKTALAMELMGRSGANMIPLLNGGSTALQSLMNEAESFGQVFTKEMGANAEAFNDNISRLQGAFGNMAAQIAEKLLPHLVAFTDWLVANAPAIANFVVEIVKFGAEIVSLGNSIVTLMTGAWAQFEAGWNRIIDLRNQFVASMKGLAEEVIAIFVAIPGKMLEIGGQIVDGLWQGIQAKWEGLKAKVTGLGHGIVDWLKSPLDINSPSRVMHEIGVNIMQGLQNGMQSLQVGVAETATSTAQGVETAFTSLQDLGQSLSSSIGDLFSGFIEGGDAAKDALKGLAKQLASFAMNDGLKALANAFGGGGSSGSGFGSILGSVFRSIIPGAYKGGSIMPGGSVGGMGGIDNQLVAFRKKPDEQVDIYNPKRRRSGGGTSIRQGDIIIQGDASEKTVKLIDDKLRENNRQLAYAQANSWRN